MNCVNNYKTNKYIDSESKIRITKQEYDKYSLSILLKLGQNREEQDLNTCEM